MSYGPTEKSKPDNTFVLELSTDPELILFIANMHQLLDIDALGMNTRHSPRVEHASTPRQYIQFLLQSVTMTILSPVHTVLTAVGNQTRMLVGWLILNVPVNICFSHVETEPPLPGYY